MVISSITPEQKHIYNAIVTHPLQSYEWGEFREKEGLKVIRRGIFDGEHLVDGFQLTLHPIPRTPYNIGYLPKGKLPTSFLINELKALGKEHNCIFIQLEPSIRNGELTKSNEQMLNLGLRPAVHPLFTKYTFILDLTKSDEEILAAMHPKARYNIKVAQKHGITVQEENTSEGFKEYWRLTEETTKRQQFYAHTKHYHELQWNTLPHHAEKNTLSSHLLLAQYQPDDHKTKKKTLTAWILFVFGDTLYYPYGASSNEHRETMHSTMMMWQAIQFGKKLGLKKFDMWGAAGPNVTPNDPWFGFTNFKQRFGPELVEFAGSFDLAINPFLYQGFKLADKARWAYLKLRR